ncbi:LysR family transcriptional regulator [Actinoplanes sp. HUAS TT8]|uniref:LysR family transcriptional regulator n=1 Tax=Actinoplanes sp. HUAS TT8 TaxID=3447453 RepID=UPI003F521554
MELRQLEHFVAVAEEGVFARAAARCRIAPSGLSTSIRALEADLGAELFARTTRRVTLTTAGSALLPQARATLSAAAAARSAVDGVARGFLAIGGIPTPGLLDQATALERFAARFPQVEVRYTNDTSDGLLDRVLGRRLDLAIVSLPPIPPAGVTVRELARGRVRLACRADHRFAGRPVVTCGEVAGEKLVTAQPGSRGHDYLERIFAAAGMPRTAPHEVHDVPTMLEFVDRGLGVALVVDGMTASRPGLSTVAIDDDALTWTLAAVTPAVSSPAAHAFLAELG